MVFYYKCWYAAKTGDAETAKQYAAQAAASPTGICSLIK